MLILLCFGIGSYIRSTQTLLVNRFKIDIKKLSDYCLNSAHPVGKHKARVFNAALGIGKSEATLLKKEILKSGTIREFNKRIRR